MRLLFLYWPPVSGKLTIGRMVADRTGMALFHNHLIVDAVAADQEERLVAADRSMFGKLQSVELLRALRPAMTACLDAMPPATLRIDTGRTSPVEAAETITRLMEAPAGAG